MAQGDMKFYADHVEYFVETTADRDRQRAAHRDRPPDRRRPRRLQRQDAPGDVLQRARVCGARHTEVAPQDARASAGDGTSDPDVQFYGETLEKTGEDTYSSPRAASRRACRRTRGGR